MKTIKDKKILHYFNEILLDFKFSKFPRREEIDRLVKSIRKVKNNSKIDIQNAGIIYEYTLYHIDGIEKVKDFYPNMIKSLNLDFNHYMKNNKDINSEWIYIKNWFENEYDISVINEWVTLKEKGVDNE